MVKAWCKNYEGMHERTACDAGVEFRSLPGYGQPGFMKNCPCSGPKTVSLCDKAVYPTAEELAAAEAAIAVRFANVSRAREAIVDHLGGPWKRGTAGSMGSIDCPICNAGGSLRFSRSGYNGHIHAACATENCVSWME